MTGTRRRRFQHSESEIVWAAIKALDPSLQHEVLRELATRFATAGPAPTTTRDKVAAAVAALHEVAAILGHSPSVKEYRKLRDELPDLGLPSDTNIRRWLGEGTFGGRGWNECLRQALLDAAVDSDFASPFVGRTYRFTDSEIFDALRACTADLGRAPTMSQYLSWAKRPDVADRPGRRPVSYHPFERYRGLRNALRQAGVISEHEARYAADGRLLPLRYSYSEQEMKDAILVVARDLGRSPRSGEYERERQRLYKKTLATNEIRPMPTAAVMRDHFGSWNAALEAVGLPPVEAHLPSFTGGHRPRYTDPQIVEWLRTAWGKIGEPFTGNAYETWRRKALNGGEAEIPSLGCVAQTFGGWNAACKRALPAEYRTGHGRVLRR